MRQDRSNPRGEKSAMTSQFPSYVLRLVGAAVVVLTGCSRASPSTQEVGFQLPSGDLGLAYSIMPYDQPQTELVEIPEAQMMAFLECTQDAIGQPVVPAKESSLDQDLAASDCALAHGLDEHVGIWTPAPQSEFAEAYDRWITTSETCFHEAGIDQIPMIEVQGIGPEPDFVGAIAQDPTLEEPLKNCMDLAGEDMPGQGL